MPSEQTNSLADTLSAIRQTIYRGSSTYAEAEAIQHLTRLACEQTPEAMHLLGQWLWEGIGVSPDENEAFRLISAAANLGCSQAMESLGAMYLVGAGCDRSFEQAQFWYSRRDETHRGVADFNSVHIGKVSLNAINFCPNFSLEINGVAFEAPTATLEKLNLSLVEQKAKIVDRQLLMIERKPECWKDIMYKRRLPWLGSIGGSTLIISGYGEIEHIGWRQWSEEFDFWIPFAEFTSNSSPPRFSELHSLVVHRGFYRSEVKQESCDEIRDALRSDAATERKSILKSLKQLFSKAPKYIDESGPLELLLTSTSVSEQATLAYRGGHQVYSYLDF